MTMTKLMKLTAFTLFECFTSIGEQRICSYARRNITLLPFTDHRMPTTAQLSKVNTDTEQIHAVYLHHSYRFAPDMITRACSYFIRDTDLAEDLTYGKHIKWLQGDLNIQLTENTTSIRQSAATFYN